jgi:hypothetical protein
LLGVAIALLPWALDVVQSPRDFAQQFGQQLLRKAGRNFWSSCLPLQLRQWGIARGWVAMVWIAGLAGLVVAAIQRPAQRWLPFAQLAMLGLALVSCEEWYGIYTVPLTYLGMTHGARGLASRGARSWAGRATFVLLAGAFALFNASRLGTLRSYDPGIPPGSTVLMESIPTPYFGLRERSDLRLRFFPPLGFDLPPATIERALDRVDVVIVGSSAPNPAVRERLEDGPPLGQVGRGEGFAFPAAVVRLRPRGEKLALPKR